MLTTLLNDIDIGMYDMHLIAVAIVSIVIIGIWRVK